MKAIDQAKKNVSEEAKQAAADMRRARRQGKIVILEEILNSIEECKRVQNVLEEQLKFVSDTPQKNFAYDGRRYVCEYKNRSFSSDNMRAR